MSASTLRPNAHFLRPSGPLQGDVQGAFSTISARYNSQETVAEQSTLVRRKIWEVEGCQCSVIGTCLSMAELRKIARKTGLRIEPGDSDFDIHVRAVQACRSKGTVSAYVNKVLDRTYRDDIRKFAKALTERELTVLWRESADAGNIPGPFWAMVSHPNSTSELLGRVFGEVHMLSHLVGAANRADIRTLKRLEQRNATLETALQESGVRLRKMAKASDEQESRHAREADKLRNECAALRNELSFAVLSRNGGGEDVRLQEELAAVESARLNAEAELSVLRARVRELEDAAQVMEKRVRLLDDETAQLELERASLEEALAKSLDAQPSGDSLEAPPGCPLPMLYGRKVLYVGGRANLVRHYQALVERMGGEFLHHDGGLECRRCALGDMLAGADMVLCPVDCVSHDACLRVKRACKAHRKRFLPLRSSGLSSLTRILLELDIGVQPRQGNDCASVQPVRN
jgi:hypothetical protein